jgi:hypothetical protein
MLAASISVSFPVQSVEHCDVGCDVDPMEIAITARQAPIDS